MYTEGKMCYHSKKNEIQKRYNCHLDNIKYFNLSSFLRIKGFHIYSRNTLYTVYCSGYVYNYK